jgi:hypothetical protein
MKFASLYIGPGLAPHLQACLSSWNDYGHSLDLYTYGDGAPVPRGVTRKDANEIVPSDEVFVYRKGGYGSVAGFSNLFRYEMIRQRDVIWVDTDVLCLSREWPVREYYLAWEDEDETLCNGAVLGMPRESELLATVIRQCRSDVLSPTAHGELGPQLITRTLRDLGLAHVPATLSDFSPLGHSEVRHFFDPARKSEVDVRVSSSYCVHLFDEMLTRMRFPSFLRPPVGSYMEEILDRHGVEIPIRAHFSDLDALDYERRPHSVPLVDFVALERWSHELESELIALRDVPIIE